MDDAFRVRRGERVGDLDAGVDRRRRRERSLIEHHLHRSALQPLHDDERIAVRGVDLVDGADVGVVQRRRGARLADEAGGCLRVVATLGGRNFSATCRPSDVSSAR